MTEEEKDLLLKDLCARSPYGVKVKVNTTDGNGDKIEDEGVLNSVFISQIDPTIYVCVDGMEYYVEDIKPYLRPMSSMLLEEEQEYSFLLNDGGWGVSEDLMTDCIDWLNEHHFDYRGLIDKGLAIEVTNDNNPYKD